MSQPMSTIATTTAPAAPPPTDAQGDEDERTPTAEPGNMAAPPFRPTPIVAGWVYLPKRETALNLDRVSRVEFGGLHDSAAVYFDHAECDDADEPGFVATALIPIHGEDVTAIRWALALPPFGGAR